MKIKNKPEYILREVVLCFVCMISISFVNAQSNDTVAFKVAKKSSLQPLNRNSSTELKNGFPRKAFVIPAFMIVYGFATLENDALQHINEEIREDVWIDNHHKKVRVDNYLQFAPAVLVYTLNVAGIQGKHNLRDRSILYMLSNLFLNTTVRSLKKITNQQRPDGYSFNSFPSGHTAEAFASAEFLRQEYKELSPWYGIAGYITAAATGVLRIYNNKHWLSDVVAGAGIGIASTKLSYWIYPAIKKKLYKSKPMNTFIIPYYMNGNVGASLIYTFK